MAGSQNLKRGHQRAKISCPGRRSLTSFPTLMPNYRMHRNDGQCAFGPPCHSRRLMMLPVRPRRMNLTLQIEEAFVGEMPPIGRLTPHLCDECDEVHSQLTGRTWQDVARNFPTYCHDAFPLLSDQAKKYYLPAYMVTSLGPDANGQGTSIEISLSNKQIKPSDFNQSQVAAIAGWVNRYFADNFSEAHPPQKNYFPHGVLLELIKLNNCLTNRSTGDHDYGIIRPDFRAAHQAVSIYNHCPVSWPRLS